MVINSKLCQLNGGCMGCCGHDFVSKGKIQEAIKKNTREFEMINPVNKEEFLEFRDRYYKSNLLNGVCRNLIEKNGRFFCPLHPALHHSSSHSFHKEHEGIMDLREGHCDVDYLCKTAKAFEKWNKEKKQKFLEFIAKKGLINIDYSIKMDDCSLLEEFESSQ